jgi:hypothetical protein
LSAIRSSVVGGSFGHTRIAMLAIGTGAAGRDSDEHRRVTVLGSADNRGSPCSSSRRASSFAPPADAVAQKQLSAPGKFQLSTIGNFAYWPIYK